MKKLTLYLFLVLMFSSSVFSEEVIIPSFEKINKEKRLEIKTPFYACIKDIEYTSEDILTGESKIETIIVGDISGEAHLYLEEDTFDKKDENAPKVGDCLAFEPHFVLPIDKVNTDLYTGYAKIFVGKYQVNNQIVEPILKDKLSVTEYFEQGVDYASKIIELNGTIFEVIENTRFMFKLFSENFEPNSHNIVCYYDSELWKNNEIIKAQLLSLKIGDKISIKGLFAGPNGFYRVFHVMSINSINNIEF